MAENEFNQEGTLLLGEPEQQPSTETETPQQTPEVAPAVTPTVDDLPAEFLQKFEGKDRNEVLKARYHAEKLIGEQGAEKANLKAENTYLREYLARMTAQQNQQQPESKPSRIPEQGLDAKYPNKVLSDDDLGFIFEHLEYRETQKQQQVRLQQQQEFLNRKSYAEARWNAINSALPDGEASQREFVLQDYLNSNPDKAVEFGKTLAYGSQREIDKTLDALTKEAEVHEKKIVDGIAKRNNIHPDQAKALREAQVQAATQPGIGNGGGGVARTKKGTELSPLEARKYGLLGVDPDDILTS